MVDDRRADPGLRFEPERGRLRLGRFSTSVPPGSSNAAVLKAYVELTARARGDRVAHVVDVRQADVDALAAALDLDADDLAGQVQLVLGTSRLEAARLVSRLRQTRVIGGLSKAAAGAVVAGALAAGCASGATDATTTTEPAVTTEATTTEATTTTTEPSPVVLIPPATEDR